MNPPLFLQNLVNGHRVLEPGTEHLGGYIRLPITTIRRYIGWLNIAENELSAMTRQCIGGQRVGDLKTLRARIKAWSQDVNKNQRGVDWQMKIDDARCKLKSVYPKIKL